MVPNDFDVQAYVFDLKTRKAEALTRKFAPSIDSAFWHPGGSIYLKVTDNDYTRLYRCAPADKKFTRLETIPDAVESVSYRRSGKAVYSGSGLGSPQKLYVLNLGSGSSRLLKDYNQGRIQADVRFGKAENWSFKTRQGKTIGGYLCFPPDFDPARLYPCIVNYYGGTSPDRPQFRRPLSQGLVRGQRLHRLRPPAQRRRRLRPGIFQRPRQRLGRDHLGGDHPRRRGAAAHPPLHRQPPRRRHRRLLRRVHDRGPGRQDRTCSPP